MSLSTHLLPVAFWRKNAPMIRRTLFLLLPLFGLAACGDTSDVMRSFGISRDAPDEFLVTTRAPLSMPPDFTLRPPTPGAARPQDVPLRTQAEATLVPDTLLTNPGTTQSPGQQALVQQAGPPAPADIRNKVGQDAAMATADRSFVDRLMFWKSPQPEGVALDASGEAQRLRQNAATGQGVDSGNSPIIQPKGTSGFLGSIF